MRKATRSPATDEITAYQLKRAERGTYADRYKASRSAEPVSNVRIWAPLDACRWAGTDFLLAEDTRITGPSAYRGYEAEEFSRFLSEDEREACRQARHWLNVVQPAHSAVSPATSVNLVLLALWMARATTTSVGLRFEESDTHVTSAVRVLERFQWIEGHAGDEIVDGDLRTTAALLAPLRRKYTGDLRVKHAVRFTFRGCVSRDWQVAFVCYWIALESLLAPHDLEGPEAMAGRYAGVVGTVDGDPKPAVQLMALAKVRSDIVHGRGHIRTDPARNIEDLAAMSQAVRRLWRTTLGSQRRGKKLASGGVGRAHASS